MSTSNRNKPTADEIIEYVATYFKISTATIKGKSTADIDVTARHICMQLVKEICQLPSKEIGKLLNKSPSTVTTAIWMSFSNGRLEKAREVRSSMQRKYDV
jgi:chromosomal replication initiation ATPase DnaA